ncbi:alkaline phosphatase synthesis sensor protein PhoR [Clostridium homopropionicum DSM 5847]|uniref:histidine kinase n=1 Tax=Clostridium homopropionicum DSM 5847 TaxID=1121318 RepID=A0A0L6ZCD3_9CLOT|nr:HAMP domain-containing sensor histidine kinase [Clostridium homopropionicum]KOA20612.1 alkaline phosphatase synthesis sensor protein PhoR [Clostridium homopropionicum DSM 5847]SFF93144.1 HAMP domain-containing protein [Clostridium homopropionicum]
MKKKIAIKLFIITVIFFIIFITTQLLFQSLFFQNFYTDRKTKILSKNLESFSKDYVKNIGNIDKTLENIKSFEENNNAKIVILESNGLLSYITDGQEMRESIKVKMVKDIIRQWTSDPEAFKDLQKKGETVTYIFNDREYNIKNIVTIEPIIFNNIPGKVIFAVSSLQSVEEAVAVMKEFYTYIYIAALVLIVLMSFIYSKIISKPLIHLNEKALKMASLDFTEKCSVESEDEIGNLGRTLNFLSDNLSSALKGLQDSNDKLKKDIEKEKQLEEMRKEFVASVSHELKTPISLIAGYAEGIKDHIVKEEDKDYYMDVIIDEAERMSCLVSDMLELSRLESGTVKINKEPFFIDKTINKIIKKLEGIKEDYNKGIKIEKSLEENLEAFGEENKIEEVITNFLTNALRHTKEEGYIFVRAKGDKAKHNIIVEIENQGEQIPEEEIEKIWDRFYKLDKSRNREAGGTGLGLAIVKNILILHDSEYGVVNTESGVKFYFIMKRNR